MRIDAEDRRYSNSTTITSSDADEGYFASVVTVQHSQKSGEQVATHESEWKKVSWPNEEVLTHSSSQAHKSQREAVHRTVLQEDNNYVAREENEIESMKPFSWISQVADSSHHLVSDAEMELQKRAFDVKHANDRSRSRTRSNFISERARSFERAQAYGTEGLPPTRRGRSPSLRRHDGDWISRSESVNSSQKKNHHRWASVGRLDTSSWETRIRQESPAPVPPPERHPHRRRHLTGEPQPPSTSIKDGKVSEWIRKSQDCLVSSHDEQTPSRSQDFEFSKVQHGKSLSESTSSFRQEESYLLQMEEEKRRQEVEIRRQAEELRRRELEAKKKELDMIRRKEELASAQLRAQEEETRRREVEVRRIEESRRREEAERQRKYEEQLKQRHMEEERRKEQRLLYEKRVQKDKEEQARLQRLQMEQRQERLRKQQEQEEEENVRMRQKEEVERQQQIEKQQFERRRLAEEAVEHESRRSRTRHCSREAQFASQERPEPVRPLTPVGVKTGHVNNKRQFFNERSKSMDRKEEHIEPRRHRCHIHKDWTRAMPGSQEADPPSRPGSSLGQSLGAVKHTVDHWNHNTTSSQQNERHNNSRARSLSHHRDWKPMVRERSQTPTRFDSVSTHQVQDTVKDWGPHQSHSGRSTPHAPSRGIAETFADSKVDSKEWCHSEEGDEAPWRVKTPDLKLVNISVKRSVPKDKEPPEILPPHPRVENGSCGAHEKVSRVPNRSILITELPDLPLEQQQESSRVEMMTSTTTTSSKSYKESRSMNKELPLPVSSESWFSGQSGKGGNHVLSTTSSASTLAHLEGLKSPTETGKTPLPVLAGWYDSKVAPKKPQASNVPAAPPLPTPASKAPQIQKYENDVDKRARELEELRNMRADRNKRLQDAFELGDPYPETEESVLSYSDGYSEDEDSQGKKDPSKPVPTRRIGNLFNRSTEQWMEEQGPSPPQRNSSKEFMKALKS